MGADMSHIQSIMVHKGDSDKMVKLSTHLLMAIAGDPGDSIQFGEYIEKNVQLYKMRNNYELPPSAAVHFTRKTLATHLRSREPYQCNMLIGGYDPQENKAELFYMDYLAASIPVNYYAHGYAGTFVLALLDREYRPDMNEGEAYALMEKCCNEVKRRFLANISKFCVRVVNKDGTKDKNPISPQAEPF